MIKRAATIYDVSIHPRLFRRGNTYTYAYVGRETGFQSTPAFSGEGTNYYELKAIRNRVSIHPRLFRRGNSSAFLVIVSSTCFNPPPPFQAREPCRPVDQDARSKFQSTPAFSGEGTLPVITSMESVLFQSTPAFSGEGTRLNYLNHLASLVSIHPRLFRRGN